MLTNAVNLETPFAKDETVVSVETHANQRSLGVERDVVFLDGLELSVHEETDIIHEEDYFVAACYFEEGDFGLEGEFGHREVFLDVVGFVLLLI
jgi:hypothetical protein